mmetsp:Transcript_15980/g.48487  ORF Transcript_15980/g.48487 Transcript_15980/m.48487 type:complete len:87 (+) Transcript_15980:663-923(+)|eukprot:scaffold23743_cov30-Tisochrysis_lutea.AAC.3
MILSEREVPFGHSLQILGVHVSASSSHSAIGSHGEKVVDELWELGRQRAPVNGVVFCTADTKRIWYARGANCPSANFVGTWELGVL